MKTLKTNCAEDVNCNCPKRGRTVAVNAVAGSRNETLDGTNFIVVPVVMAIEDVVMNGAVLDHEDWFPLAWDGVPVTVGHPEDDNGGFLSANNPASRQKYAVGTIYNTTMDGGKLKAEAWLDKSLLSSKFPQALAMIQQNKPLDVSTGYFADHVEETGVLNGKEYTARHVNIIPDHLALLPSEEGACSFDEGCGVRANKDKTVMKKLSQVLVNALKHAKKGVVMNAVKIVAGKDAVKNADGTAFTFDPAAAVAEIISCEGSPFSADDQKGLEALSEEALQALYAQYCVTPGDPAAVTDPTDQPAVAADAGNCDDPMAKGGPKVAGNKTTTAPVMTKEERSALDHALKVQKDHKASVIAKIVANSRMTKDVLEAMELPQLEAIADGLVVHSANFSGRAVPTPDPKDTVAAEMRAPSVVEAIRNKRKSAA